MEELPKNFNSNVALHSNLRYGKNKLSGNSTKVKSKDFLSMPNPSSTLFFTGNSASVTASKDKRLITNRGQCMNSFKNSVNNVLGIVPITKCWNIVGIF